MADDDILQVRGSTVPEPVSPLLRKEPTGLDTLGAAFRQDNPVFSVLSALAPQRPVDENFNPLDEPGFKGSKYEQRYLDEFVSVANRDEYDALRSRIDQEERDRETLDGAGGWGTAASVLAGVLDPTLFIPVGGEIAAARGAAAVGRTAARIGVASGFQASVSEAALQASQATRSDEQTALSIGTGTLLGALLGSGAAALLGRSERAAVEQALEADRVAVGKAIGFDSSVGAAQADRRQLELVEFTPDWIRQFVPPSYQDKAGDWLLSTSPTLRTFRSGNVEAKRAMADLVETPLRFKDAEEGLTPSQYGTTVDRLIRATKSNLMIQSGDVLKNAFVAYRGLEGQRLAGTRALVEDVTGQAGERLSYGSFKAEVTRALMNGDVHEIPQVQQAAQAIRSQVLDATQKWLQKIGLLPEELEGVAGDPTWFARLPNREVIAARRTELKDTITGWLESEQATKAQAQERLRAYHGALESHQSTIDKLERQIDKRSAALDDVEVRREEVRRFNAFAFKRSDQLSEPLDLLRTQTRRVEDRIAPHLERLDEIASQIRQQREQFPEIREADIWVRRLSAASQRMRNARDAVEMVDSAGQYVEDLDTLIKDFRGEIRSASERARELRHNLGADDLMALEEARTDLNAAIVPQQKQLRALRKQLREERDAIIQNARGGAVFEAEIRRRGNDLADRASGRDAEIKALEDKLAQEVLNHDAMRSKIEDEIAAWEGKSSAEAKTALKAREKAESERAATATETGGRLTQADGAIDRAVKRIIESDRELSRDELAGRSDEIINRWLSGPDGRLPYDAPSGGPRMGAPTDGPQPRGSLNAREWAIPTNLIWDFVEHDAEHLLNRVLGTVLPDGFIHERFGDVEMRQAFRRLDEDANRRVSAAKSDAERTKIEKERQSNIEDLAGVRDRLRGIYGASDDPMQRRAAKLARIASSYNTVTDLGTAALNSMGDMAGLVFRYGLTSTFRDGWAPLIASMGRNDEFKGAALRQAKAAQIAVETSLNLRAHALTDVLDHQQPGSKFERGIRWAADKSQLVNGQAWFTDTVKTVAATVTANDMLRAMEKVAKGTATKGDIENLAARNINAADAAAIWRQFENGGGDTIRGVRLANTEDWSSDRLRQVFEGALAREVDIAVITPGAEKPLWMSKPVAGLLGQFKSFVAGTHERTLLAQMQQRDGRTLAGLMSAMALGMLSYRLYTLVSGQPFDTKPQQLVKEGLSRSGVLGWMDEANSIAAKTTRGMVDIHRLYGADKPLSRYASRSILSTFLGPTAGKVEGTAASVGAVMSGDFSGGDTTRVRRLIPFQNLFFIRGLINQAEVGFNEVMGIPQKAPTPVPAQPF